MSKKSPSIELGSKKGDVMGPQQIEEALEAAKGDPALLQRTKRESSFCIPQMKFVRK